MHTARIPPVDPTPATITAVLATHAGHIGPPRNEELQRTYRPHLLKSLLSIWRAGWSDFYKPGKKNWATFLKGILLSKNA